MTKSPRTLGSWLLVSLVVGGLAVLGLREASEAQFASSSTNRQSEQRNQAELTLAWTPAQPSSSETSWNRAMTLTGRVGATFTLQRRSGAGQQTVVLIASGQWEPADRGDRARFSQLRAKLIVTVPVRREVQQDGQRQVVIDIRDVAGLEIDSPGSIETGKTITLASSDLGKLTLKVEPIDD